jgi:uncharacterized phage-associated protein
MKIEKELNQIPAVLLADFVLKNYGPMSHLKLQKLLYYCEGYHLAYFESPLLHEEFEAWVHGPVCVPIYDLLKGSSVLYTDVSFGGEHNPDEVLQNELASKQIEIIKETLLTLSPWMDSELETATHREQPWIDARGGIPASQRHNGVISKVTMMNYYKGELS